LARNADIGKDLWKTFPEDERDIAFNETKGRTKTSYLRNIDIFFVGEDCHTVL
jgi:hypothetical protein